MAMKVGSAKVLVKWEDGLEVSLGTIDVSVDLERRVIIRGPRAMTRLFGWGLIRCGARLIFPRWVWNMFKKKKVKRIEWKATDPAAVGDRGAADDAAGGKADV